MCRSKYMNALALFPGLPCMLFQERPGNKAMNVYV